MIQGTSSKAQRERKGIATLVVNWEVGGPYGNPRYLPLDDFRCEIVELYPKVERHKNLRNAETGVSIDPVVINLCYKSVHGDEAMQSQAKASLATLHERLSTDYTEEGWLEQWGWGGTLQSWLEHGNETYYQAGAKYSYIWHSYTIPSLSVGGVIEPFPNGGPLLGNALFSWLRLADNIEPAGVNGSVFKITSTWLGGPDGHWDPKLYS